MSSRRGDSKQTDKTISNSTCDLQEKTNSYEIEENTEKCCGKIQVTHQRKSGKVGVRQSQKVKQVHAVSLANGSVCRT